MKVYLAARYDRREEMQQYFADLGILDIECTSRWITDEHSDRTLEAMRECAEIDLVDVEACDMMICFTEKQTAKATRGGRHVEFGFAIASGKPVICIGPCENIFFALPQVQIVENWLEAVKILIERKKRS